MWPPPFALPVCSVDSWVYMCLYFYIENHIISDLVLAQLVGLSGWPLVVMKGMHAVAAYRTR